MVFNDRSHVLPFKSSLAVSKADILLQDMWLLTNWIYYSKRRLVILASVLFRQRTFTF